MIPWTNSWRGEMGSEVTRRCCQLWRVRVLGSERPTHVTEGGWED
jgi:hypothetical protein